MRTLMIAGIALALTAAAAPAAHAGANAGKLTILYSFHCGADACNPVGKLLSSDGVLYGTTISGGTQNHGTVFSLDPSTGVETVLYSFSGGTDGDSPTGGL